MAETKYNISTETEAIKKYFEKEQMKYIPLFVIPQSNHPEDSHIFGVVAESTTHPGTYAAWTTWNASTQSLNHGHYDLSDIHDGLSILNESFNDIRPESKEFRTEKIMKDFKTLSHMNQFYAVMSVESSEWNRLSDGAKQIVYDRYMDRDEIYFISDEIIDLVYSAEDWAEEIRYTAQSQAVEDVLIADEVETLLGQGFKENEMLFNVRPEYSKTFDGPIVELFVNDGEDSFETSVYLQISRCPESDEGPAGWDVALVLPDQNDFVSLDGTWPDSFKTVKECLAQMDEYMKPGGILEKKIGKFENLTERTNGVSLESESRSMSEASKETSQDIDMKNNNIESR